MSSTSTDDGITSFPESHSPPTSSDPNPENGVGLANPQLSLGRRQTLDLVNRLHSTGVQVDIDLPQIAVIGSQSAGKSSLIESISGITLPRAAGTCTRCPTECRLSRSNEPWKCIVALCIFQDGKMTNENFGGVIVDKSDVEDRIRRAQRAILNPIVRKEKGAKYFLINDDEASVLELSFSSNFVSLQISGPEVADLSFVDLPGLIAGVGRTGNTDDIDLVKSLVASYIKRPSCIILLTVACETDFQNQGAQELAKQHDPDGKRTIGVLTKPDRIPSGEEPNWTQLIRNEKEPLENGWYCVKQPASKEFGISWAEARKRENDFFTLTPAWSELESVYQKYLRTGNLVERLSALLSDLISKRLPQIQREIERSILRTREALEDLPKAPSSDPVSEIANMLHGFVRDLARHVEGVPDEDGLLQSIRPAQTTFRRAVRATAPEFMPFEKRYAGLKNIEKAEFLANEDEADDLLVGDFGEESDSEEEEEDDGRLRFDFRPRVRPGIAVEKRIWIDEVFNRAHQARTRELPGSYPFVVQETYIKAITKKWHAPAHILCRTIYSVLGEHIKRLVSATFGSFGQGQLEQRIKVLLQDHLNKCMERTEERISWLLDLEDRPFTLNTHYLADYKEKFLAYYKGAREKDRNATLLNAIKDYTPPTSVAYPRGLNVSPAQPTGIAKVLAGLVEVGINGIKPEDLAKLIPSDGMEPALVIMADVRAYFQVAYKRIADNIPLAIDHELVRGLERNVLQTLNSGLRINGVDGQQICRELAQENPTIAGRREELEKKLERMYSASRQLLQI